MCEAQYISLILWQSDNKTQLAYLRSKRRKDNNFLQSLFSQFLPCNIIKFDSWSTNKEMEY